MTTWNSISGQPLSGAWINEIALTMNSPSSASANVVSGLESLESADTEALFEHIDGWFDLLFTWVAVLVNQDTHHLEPLRSITVPGAGLTLQAVHPDGTVSGPRASRVLQVVVGEPEPLTQELLRSAFERSSNGSLPSDARLLLRDARVDHRRERLRKAVIDAGSAVESALAGWCRSNGVALPKRPTLGWFVANSGASVPANTAADLVTVRNDAIHNNITPAPDVATRALEIAATILDLIDPV